VRLIGSTIVVLAFFLNAKTTTDALKQIKQILKIYIPLSFLAILLVPAATQWEWPAWRGLASDKNTLGQISFISAVVLAYGMRGLPTRKVLVSCGFLLSAVVLIVGSKSTTGLIALMSICLMSIWLFVDRRAGRLMALALAVCILSLTVLGGALETDKIVAAFGRDTTFSGRSDLWPVLIDEAKFHPIIGCGFNGFWVADNPSVVRLYAWDQFPWKPNEGHEGYLDLLNEIGAVGVLLLALMILRYFKNLMKLRKPLYWKWFFIGILIVNLTESTLFRSSNFVGWMFVMSYLALYVELIRQESYARVPMAAAAWGVPIAMETKRCDQRDYANTFTAMIHASRQSRSPHGFHSIGARTRFSLISAQSSETRQLDEEHQPTNGIHARLPAVYGN